jgi:hypothetical protein
MKQLLRITEKTILVTHRDCLDGVGCAFTFCLAGGSLQNVIFIPAGGIENFVKKDQILRDDCVVIFADVSPSTKACADNLEKRGNVFVIDHHASSAHLANRAWAIINTNVCATTLLKDNFDFTDRLSVFETERMDQLSHIVNDYDMWICEEPASQKLALLMNHYGQSKLLQSLCHVSPYSFIYLEKRLVEQLEENRDDSVYEALKHSFVKKTLFPNEKYYDVCYVVSSNQHISFLLNEALNYRNVDVAAQINFDKGTVSLRSRGNINVAEFAKCFGGGGHLNAAGHKIPSSMVYAIVEELHNV